MSRCGAAASMLAALVLTTGALGAQTAQDSEPQVRHILAINYARVRPFSRSYDMLVVEGDSVVPIGRRDVTFAPNTAPDSSPGWLLVESRTGIVTSLDSIFIAADLRPVRWHSVLGPARLDLAFTADSAAGAVQVGAAGTHFSLAIPPDLVASSATMEVLAGLLPLAPAWSDSAYVLSVDAAGAKDEPALLAVDREDAVAESPGAPPRPCWVVTLTSGLRQSRVWVDRQTLDVVRVQTPLPSHTGSMLEYRARPVVPLAP